MNQALAYRISLAGGIVMVLLVVASQFMPLTACGGLPANYQPLVAFELSRSLADLQAIFGGGACRATLTARLNIAMWIDTLAFVPAYGVFLAFFFIAMAPRDEKSAFIGFVVAAVTAAAGIVENICQFEIAASLDAPGIWLGLLPWLAGLKWLGLGLCAAIGGLILSRGGRLNYPATALCGLSFLSVGLALANPRLFGSHVAGGVALSWIVFLVVDARGALAMGAIEQA